MTGHADETKKAIGDALSFPILTEEVTLPSTPSEVSTPPGRSPLAQIVQGALGEVLGYLPKSTDPNSFLEALNKSFTLEEVSGHTQYTWMPRGYTAYTELGAVTGAQASLFVRATSALDDSLPLLDGLKPLRSDSDPEDSQAARAIVRSNLTELVTELGVVGGPRVQRVDDLFRLLLGAAPVDAVLGAGLPPQVIRGPMEPQPSFPFDLFDPDEVQGNLGLLRERLGLEGDRVNTIEEERNLTNFLVLVEYVVSLLFSWVVFRQGFTGNAEVFFGTQLVLLSRSLGVVAESVDEAYYAMNSLFLGPAEREATDLDLEGEQPITLAELLDWVRTVAAVEGPRLIQEGGKDGVITLVPTLRTLAGLVSATLALAGNPGHNPTAAFHHPRVERALEEIRIYLEEASERAEEITRGRPAVTAVDPVQVTVPAEVRLDTAPAEVRLDVDGEGFQEGGRVSLRRNPPSQYQPTSQVRNEIVGGKVTLVSPNQIRASFSFVGSDAGRWDVVVTNPDLGEGILEKGFEVLGPPRQHEEAE